MQNVVAFFVPLLLACGGVGAGQDAGSDVMSADVVSDVVDAAVVHPTDASPQVIVTDESANDGGLLVFAAPLTDASAPLFKIATITPSVSGYPNVVRIGPDGWTLWVADQTNGTIDAFDLPLTPSSAAKQTIQTLNTPRDLRFDSKGDLFASISNSGIEWWAPPFNDFKPTGLLVHQVGYSVGGLVFDSNDTLYADSNTYSTLVFSNPTSDSNPTVVSTPGWDFSGYEIAQGRLFGLNENGGLTSYPLPLVQGAQQTFVYNVKGGSRLALSPTMDLVAPDIGRILLFAPPYTAITTIVSLPQYEPTSVAFFTPP